MNFFQNNMLVFRRAAIVLCCMLVLWKAAILVPGFGIQSVLDARHGTTETAFAASLEKAVVRMPAAQIRALEWALSRLDSKTFVSRYGQAPLVRQVIVGEIMFALDEARREIADAEMKIMNKNKELEESNIRRKKVLSLLNTVVPVITQIDIPRVGSGEGFWVRYRIENPLAIPLEVLPCRVVYHSRNQNRVYERDFDCLSMISDLGEGYIVKLKKMDGFQSSDVVVSLVALHEMIKTSSLVSFLTANQAATTGTDLELEKIRQAKNLMKHALQFKAAL